MEQVNLETLYKHMEDKKVNGKSGLIYLSYLAWERKDSGFYPCV